MLDKKYNASEIEARLYKKWEKSGAFSCGDRQERDSFSIVMPPPNVTGHLHIGHALNHSLQDILVRFKRMQGFDVLWQPGMDHAGIATQMVVERQLAEEGLNRQTLGREAFIQRVWDWKAKSGGMIEGQLRRLGTSCDWSRERFTMDEGLSKAVLRVFVEWYREGLIYKDHRLVNWDPKLETAISDLEVEMREVNGHLWHINYPIDGQEGRFITVATTRPETMLGDTGIAVHPEDDRYQDLIGQHAVLPLVGRKLKIVADEHADPEQGSGAVKITPAHDFNDFEVGKRHGLEMINILDQTGHLNESVPEIYQGMERYEARKSVLRDLGEAGALEKTEDHTHTVPYGDRSGVVIEPWLTEQWYADAPTLAKQAIAAVEVGDTRFVPKNWEKTYFQWMRNIEPWCISRQLWWGHQIPAWYAESGEIFVAETEEEAKKQAQEKLGEGVCLTRDEDVLDTWFSSALWPFSTLGWPEETPELNRYYPTSVLVTGFDIIFFWVARMMMAGLYFTKEIPFRDVYVHALVRDEKGQKMSKSKGNVIDPLELIDRYGADAMRFTLAAMAAQGRDISLSEKRVEGYRNFVTKLWNVARFCEMNECSVSSSFAPMEVREELNRWIISALTLTAREVSSALESYRFNDAANEIYRFTWGSFCDWYIEFSKPGLSGENEALRAETRQTAGWVLDQILKLLHPIMPFVTEELWQELNESRESALIVSEWPELEEDLIKPEAQAELDWVIRLISEIRAVRAEMNVPASAKIPLLLRDAGEKTQARLKTHEERILRLARLERVDLLEGETPAGSVQAVLDEATLVLPLAGIIDLDVERARLQKAIAKTEGEIAGLEKKLANEKFTAKAPEAVVEKERARREEAVALKTRLEAALSRLS